MSIELQNESDDQMIDKAVSDFNRSVSNILMGGFDTGRVVTARLEVEVRLSSDIIGFPSEAIAAAYKTGKLYTGGYTTNVPVLGVSIANFPKYAGVRTH